MKKLSSKLSNDRYRIVTIDDSEVKNRLYEMGIYPNQPIKLVRKAPFGDPLMIHVDEQLIMLRAEEAALITVEEI